MHKGMERQDFNNKITLVATSPRVKGAGSICRIFPRTGGTKAACPQKNVLDNVVKLFGSTAKYTLFELRQGKNHSVLRSALQFHAIA